MPALVDLYRTFARRRTGRSSRSCTSTRFSAAETARDAAHLKQVNGACKEPAPIEIRNDFSGRFSATCERGRVEYDVQIDADGRFVDVLLTSRDVPPSPTVARAAARIAALIKRWDAATYDALLAPALAKSDTQALFARMRTGHKACTIGAPLEGEGEASATVALDCAEGGPLALSLTVDARGERVVRMTINPLLARNSTGRCPER